MSNILRLGLGFLAPKARAFEEATKDPIRVQEKILFEYLKRNRKTEYGSKYNFSRIKSISDFQAFVPLTDSDAMRTFIQKAARGENNVLTRDEIIFFGSTSGTTNLPKLIPTTRYSESKKKELMDLWGYYIYRDHPDILDGKILAIVSPEVEGSTESGIPYGAESGYAYHDLPPLVRNLYILPYEVFEIKDYDARYYTILLISMESNITSIATLNPNTIILLCHKIQKWQDLIIEDIKKGTLNKTFDIQGAIRNKLERRFRPNPKRAGEFEVILKEGKELLPKYFWPNMKLIECWKGGTMKLYLKELPKYFGDVPIRDIGCLSTEARSSIPTSDEGAGGVLAIQTNFYEFIPKEDIGKKEKRILLADQLEKGKDYFIVVTTPGGLYRYNIDDIIRVDGFFNKTPVIEFLQKGLSATSLAGEKLYESQLEEALNKVLANQKILLEFFSASVQIEKTPRYVFLVEFSENPSPGEKKQFLKSLEEELYRQNREYEFVRRAQLLNPPVLKIVQRGDFEKYRAKKIQEGTPDGQFKIPGLTADLYFQDNFHIAEEVLID